MAETANNVVSGARSSIAVTGGTGDIGIEICRALARVGVEPAAIDLDPPEAGEAKLSAAGVQAAYPQADVTDRRQLGDALGSIVGLVGAVANAGVVDSSPFLEVTEEQWAHHLAVNLTGAFNTAQLVCSSRPIFADVSSSSRRGCMNGARTCSRRIR